VVRILIDACDREIIAWSAVANAGISGEMICDLMIAAVEHRFQALKVPHRLEWLSDNCSAYIARQTAEIAAALGIDLLFTPVRSPQSNGMSQAFVKTLKKDYASAVILPDADTILALLPDWIDDYRGPSALRTQVPLTTRVPAPQCISPTAACPAKRGPLQSSTIPSG
jgi:transposase InsO family protein